MSEKQEKAVDQILDLLLDALAERQQARTGQSDEDATPEEGEPKEYLNPYKQQDKSPEPEPVIQTKNSQEEPEATVDAPGQNDEEEPAEVESAEIAPVEEELDYWDEPAEPLPSIHMNKIFYRLSIALLFLIVLVNVPFNRFGTNLARAMPDERALIVRDGLLFTGPGDEIYILEGNQKRWISSLDAFELHNYHWEQVHEVDQEFVDQFPDGPPLHVLIRCADQPHIYSLEEGEKRWIENPIQFERAGFQWSDIVYIGCRDLKRRFPDGVPIPPDAGEPPSW